MNIVDIMNEITQITDNADINMENWLGALKYTSRLSNFINYLKPILQDIDYTFLPTFKDRYTCSKYGLAFESEETNMRRFIIVSPSFLEDVKIREIEDHLSKFVEFIKFDKDKLEIILK